MLNKNSEILVYVKKVLNKFTGSTIKRRGWFEHFEHVFLFELVQVLYQEVSVTFKKTSLTFYFVIQKLDDGLPSIYYELLLAILPFLHKGSHYLAQEIFKFLFFDTSFWKR